MEEEIVKIIKITSVEEDKNSFQIYKLKAQIQVSEPKEVL